MFIREVFCGWDSVVRVNRRRMLSEEKKRCTVQQRVLFCVEYKDLVNLMDFERFTCELLPEQLKMPMRCKRGGW